MRARVAKMGGFLAVDSVADQGTCVRARIPVGVNGA
jgi:signal transduction histidine kinase